MFNIIDLTVFASTGKEELENTITAYNKRILILKAKKEELKKYRNEITTNITFCDYKREVELVDYLIQESSYVVEMISICGELESENNLNNNLLLH